MEKVCTAFSVAIILNLANICILERNHTLRGVHFNLYIQNAQINCFIVINVMLCKTVCLNKFIIVFMWFTLMPKEALVSVSLQVVL